MLQFLERKSFAISKIELLTDYFLFSHYRNSPFLLLSLLVFLATRILKKSSFFDNNLLILGHSDPTLKIVELQTYRIFKKFSSEN